MGRFIIKLETNAAQIVKQLETMPKRMQGLIKKAMDQQNQEAVGWIQARRLTGKGPFPVSDRRLGVVTNRLRKSLRATKARVVGNRIESDIGTNVKYAATHEFGFTGSVGVKRHSVSSFLRRVPGLKRRKRVQAHERGPFSRFMRIPQRMPIAAGLEDRAESYGKAFSKAIVDAWKGENANG